MKNMMVALLLTGLLTNVAFASEETTTCAGKISITNDLGLPQIADAKMTFKTTPGANVASIPLTISMSMNHSTTTGQGTMTPIPDENYLANLSITFSGDDVTLTGTVAFTDSRVSGVASGDDYITLNAKRGDSQTAVVAILKCTKN